MLAGRAWFVFRVNLNDATGYEGFEGYAFNIFGEGVTILDEVAEMFTKFPRATIALDYGSLVEDSLPVGPDNIADLRAAFVAIHGEVYKPDVWNKARS